MAEDDCCYLTRQDATLEFECGAGDDRDTFDEGSHSPTSQRSLSSDLEDFQCSHTAGAPEQVLPEEEVECRAPVDVAAFDAMVRQQKLERKIAAASSTQNWATSMHSDLHRNLHPELRLPGLLAEAFRYEATNLRKAHVPLTSPIGKQQPAGEADAEWDSPMQSSRESPLMSPEQLASLHHDLRRSYLSLLNEVRRAVRSHPTPSAESSEQKITLEQHRQNVANQGMQCFSAMLPYSDGVCGAMTDVRRATAARLNQSHRPEDGFHSLMEGRPSTSSSSSHTIRGTVIGRSGRMVPISLSADHGKSDKIAAIRRRGIVRHTPQHCRRAATPMFAPAPRSRTLRPMMGLAAPPPM